MLLKPIADGYAIVTDTARRGSAMITDIAGRIVKMVYDPERQITAKPETKAPK